MLNEKLVPNIDMFGKIESSKFTSTGVQGMRMPSIEQPETTNFKSVMSGLVENLNQEVNKPDELLKDHLMGNQNIDVHDVMAAVSKAEIGINLATQVTSKVLQSYEKVMQISI